MTKLLIPLPFDLSIKIIRWLVENLIFKFIILTGHKVVYWASIFQRTLAQWLESQLTRCRTLQKSTAGRMQDFQCRIIDYPIQWNDRT